MILAAQQYLAINAGKISSQWELEVLILFENCREQFMLVTKIETEIPELIG